MKLPAIVLKLDRRQIKAMLIKAMQVAVQRMVLNDDQLDTIRSKSAFCSKFGFICFNNSSILAFTMMMVKKLTLKINQQ
jgi:hypothetical protein